MPTAKRRGGYGGCEAGIGKLSDETGRSVPSDSAPRAPSAFAVGMLRDTCGDTWPTPPMAKEPGCTADEALVGVGDGRRSAKQRVVRPLLELVAKDERGVKALRSGEAMSTTIGQLWPI